MLRHSKCLDAIKETKVKNLLFSSTAAVYKDGMYRVTENSIVKPKVFMEN